MTVPLKGKAFKQVVHTEMHKFKEGDLHSGSKKGPVVKNRKQAVAIALSESGQSKRESPAHEAREHVAPNHRPPAVGSHGYGHGVDVRKGPLRMSGHSGAHRIGKR